MRTGVGMGSWTTGCGARNDRDLATGQILAGCVAVPPCLVQPCRCHPGPDSPCAAPVPAWSRRCSP
jgi:hypothetical protein